MTDRPRFEVVQDLTGWHARYIHPRLGSWNAQNRNMRRKAVVDIYGFTGHTVAAADPASGYAMWVQSPHGITEVRDVDERPVGLVHGSHAGVNRGCPCELCRNFRAEYVNSGVRDGEAS